MIDENIAKTAWNNVHMSDYIENSSTNMWKEYVKEAQEIINNNELMTEEEKQNAIERYKKKTAEWINSENQNNANHVSQFVCGAGNYNMEKHDKFLKREDTLMEKRKYIFDVDNYIKQPKIRNEIKQNIEQKEYYINDIKVIQNVELNRLQLYFDGKPNEDIRELLKHNAYKW